MMQTIFSWFRKEGADLEPSYRSREVWTYTHIDPVTRQTSKRPVLIYRKASDGMFWGLPLTKVRINGRATYVPRLKNGRKVSALSQMRTLKASRLVRKLGTAGEKEFATLHNSIVRLLAETAPVQKQRKNFGAPKTMRVRYGGPSPLSPIYILQPR
ncbi:MAG TPA: hypothetical protein VNM40_03425 [Candidatus Paceibacterota bacterium]|nr:hypothetical protein [Candidatus Paceibacterota bacterium]